MVYHGFLMVNGWFLLFKAFSWQLNRSNRKQIANNYSLVDQIFQNMISLKEVFSIEKVITTRLYHDGITVVKFSECRSSLCDR